MCPRRGTESVVMFAKNSSHFGIGVSPAESGFLLPLDLAGPLQAPALRHQMWERSHFVQAASVEQPQLPPDFPKWCRRTARQDSATLREENKLSSSETTTGWGGVWCSTPEGPTHAPTWWLAVKHQLYNHQEDVSCTVLVY